MATILSQRVFAITDGNIVATLIALTSTSDTVTLPRMSGTSGKVMQLIRRGDITATLNQTSATSVTVTGGIAGNQVLLVSLHLDPIPNPTGDGA